MKQSILKHGDLVKYLRETDYLNSLGFVLGKTYLVFDYGGREGLKVFAPNGAIQLVDCNGQLMGASDCFTKHRCPIVLPRGV